MGKRRYRNPPRQNRYEPASKKGNLYYVRLRTPVGLLYKLGFTTLSSVGDRLAFDGSRAQHMIDKVLMFLPFDNAWHLEQELHKVLKKKAAFSGWDDGMPLYGNGQAELYVEDVLELDSSYSYRQAQDTRDEIEIGGHVSYGGDEKLIRESYRQRRAKHWHRQAPETSPEPDAKYTWILRPVFWPFRTLVKGAILCVLGLLNLINKLSETGHDERLVELRSMLQGELAIARQTKIRLLKLEADQASWRSPN